jgi:hypothetical protein
VIADRTATYAFGKACAAHDYGYDLIRAGVLDPHAKARIDTILVNDVQSHCDTRAIIIEQSCEFWVGPIAFAVTIFGTPDYGQAIGPS